MQKFKRIVFCLLLITFLAFGCYILLQIFNYFKFDNKIEDDPTLLIPIFLTLFSVVSLLFNINKLQKQLILQSSFYKILRIGDIIFSISIFILSLVGLYFLIESADRTTLELKRQIITFSVLIVIFFCSILLFFDNIIFHKKQENIQNKDFIDEIGQ